MKCIARNLALLSLSLMSMASGATAALSIFGGLAGYYNTYMFSDGNYKNRHKLDYAKFCCKEYERFMTKPSLCIGGLAVPSKKDFLISLKNGEDDVYLPYMVSGLKEKIGDADIKEYRFWIEAHPQCITESDEPENDMHRFVYKFTQDELIAIQNFLRDKRKPNDILACSDGVVAGLPRIFKLLLVERYADLYTGACYSLWPEHLYYAKNAAVLGLCVAGSAVLVKAAQAFIAH